MLGSALRSAPPYEHARTSAAERGFGWQSAFTVEVSTSYESLSWHVELTQARDSPLQSVSEGSSIFPRV